MFSSDFWRNYWFWIINTSRHNFWDPQNFAREVVPRAVRLSQVWRVAGGATATTYPQTIPTRCCNYHKTKKNISGLWWFQGWPHSEFNLIDRMIVQELVNCGTGNHLFFLNNLQSKLTVDLYFFRLVKPRVHTSMSTQKEDPHKIPIKNYSSQT